MGHAIQILNAVEKVRRLSDFKLAMESFTHMLYRIYTIMPHPGYIMNFNTGELEPPPPLPEWQCLIDKINEMRDEYIKTNFPEFYKEH